MISRIDLEAFENKTLKPYACKSADASRNHNFKKHPLRTEFQRDRDRIIHSKAFRRLEYKTQVFLTQKGDHLRTRLTHSLEVAQLGRTIGLQLGLNVDLIEAISLGHDVGHTPFGYIGERTINKILCTDENVVFKHNVHSVCILEELEKKYHYTGLGLTLPVLEGILKHTKMPDVMPNCCSNLYTDKNFSVTLEGQVVSISDEIAQITHDMDDYLRYNIVELQHFLDHDLFKKIDDFNRERYSYPIHDHLCHIESNDIKREVAIRCIADYLVTTLIEQCEPELKNDLEPFKLEKTYIKYSKEIDTLVDSYHKYLDSMILNDYRIKEMDRRGKDIVNSLFKYYKEFENKLPNDIREEFYDKGDIAIANYIAGMTDRFAIEKYTEMINII